MSTLHIIKRETHLLGVRFWAQWYTCFIPRFEVFEYVGRQQATGLYWFKSRIHKSLVARSLNQLNSNGFRPFVLDIRYADKWLDDRAPNPPGGQV